MRDDHHITLIVGIVILAALLGSLVLGAWDLSVGSDIVKFVLCVGVAFTFLLRGIRGNIDQRRRIKKIMEEPEDKEDPHTN